jgi:hypothetical protein
VSDIRIDVNDTQFEESVIEAVREHDSGYELTHNGAWVIYCEKVEGLPAPCVGETLRTYGRGIGSTVRGIVVNGRVYRYLTEAQDNERHEAWCREEEAKRERKYAENIVDTDRRVVALPVIFQERIARFRRDGGHRFRRDYEGYELFCCEQAVVIADTLKTVEGISAFHAAPWDEQKRLVPGIDDGHSGNTFGTACLLARAYVERPEFVTRLHGALTPLVGCDDYGCKHPEPRP